MPKRFYFTNAAAAADPVPFSSWDQTAGHATVLLGHTKAGMNLSVGVAETSPDADWDVLLVQAVSDPIQQGVTFTAGSSYIYVRGRQESSTNADLQSRLIGWVLAPDGTNRGTLIGGLATTEWPTAMSAGSVSGTVAFTVAVQPGDRIVIEMGYRSPASQTSPTTSYTGTVRYGGTDATDLEVGNASTTGVLTRSPWIEFADDTFTTAFTAPPATVGQVAAPRTATTTATGQRTDTGQVTAPRTAATTASAARIDTGQVTAARTAGAATAATRSDTGQVAATRTAGATATAATGTDGQVNAPRTAGATATANTSSPAQVSATRTAAVEATPVRSDAGQVSATRTAGAQVTPVQPTAQVDAGRTAAATATGQRTDTGQVDAPRTAATSPTATRSDAGQVDAGRTAGAQVTPVQPTGQVNAVRTAGASPTGLRTDRAQVTAPRGPAPAITGLRTDFAQVATSSGSSASVAASSISALGSTGGALNPSVWAVDRTTREVTGPLPAWTVLALSPVENSPGSCTLTYPAGAPGFDTLFAGVSPTPQRDQEIEVWLDGSRASRTRWLLQQKTGDDVALGQTWTFTGHGLEQLLDEIVVGPQNTESKELVFTSATFGTILATAVQQAKARDTAILPGVTIDFTATVDSAGQPWASTISELKFAPDDTLLGVAQAGVEEGIGEFRMTADRVLRAFNPGTRGVDRSLGGTPLRLQAGVNLDEASRRESSRVGDAGTAALGKGADGQYQWAIDTTAQAERGRRVEVPIDAGQQASAGAVQATAAVRLAELRRGVSERTHGIVFGPGLPLPGVDFDVHDWALSVTGNAATRQRIAQWTVTFDRDRGATGTVRTNTLIEDRLSRLTRRLNAVQRGGVIAGTSTAAPDVDDGKAPAQVLGLTASSSSYAGPNGTSLAAIVADWADVTTNADGTPADDIVGYAPQYRYVAGQNLPTGWTALGQTTESRGDYDRFIANRQVELRVAAVDRYGRAGATSAVFTLTTGTDTTPPPRLSAPTPAPYLGTLRIAWDGKTLAGEPLPPDFDRAELFRSQSNDFATAVYTDQYAGPGAVIWTVPTPASYGVTQFFWLVAVDRSGNRSAPSAVAFATPVTAADGDVSALNVGKLTSGVMTAVVAMAGEFRTAAPPNARVSITSDGIRKYDVNNVARVTITDDQTRIDGEIVVQDPGSNSRVQMGVGSGQRANLQTFDAVEPNSTVVIGQVYNAAAPFAPLRNGILVQRGDNGTDIAVISGAGDLVGTSLRRPGTGTVGLNIVQGQNDSLVLRDNADPNGRQAYLGPLLTGSTSDGQGLFITGQGSSQTFINERNLTYRGRDVSGRFGHIDVDGNDNYAFLGIAAADNRNGVEVANVSGFVNLRVPTAVQVVDSFNGAWRPVRASAFEVQSSAAVKERVEPLPRGASLDAVRGAPATSWRRTGDQPDAPRYVGPMAEDLPAWLVRPPVVQMPQTRRTRTVREGDDGEVVVDVHVEADPGPGLPEAESVDLLSMIGTLWEAVRELDAELDEYRRERGQTLPARRSTTDLLADLRAGLLRRTP